MTYKRALSIALFLLIHTFTLGQITIGFPVERMVFQRNNSNTGYVNVYGNVAQDCDRVEARLVARSSGQGVTTSWAVIDSRVDGQAFSGKIQNSGGWYTLEVRGIKNESVLFSSSVERVGIGEVFLIAGQSNAQGYGTAPNAKGANDDRVNTYVPRYHDTHASDQYINLPNYLNDLSFAKLDADKGIGPTGYTPYCYGELGDMLVSRLNVPVLFFNAAFTGTSTTNWVQSAQGIRTYNEQFRSAELFNGAPYRAFQVTLQSINTLLGFRSVLWHQGEHDRFTNGSGLSAGEYAANLRYLIDRSRSDIGAQIPWVVARVSRYLGSNDQRMIDGQNMVINSVQSVWAGPATDNIQPNRYDGGHFQNVPGSMGLTELASAWNASLTDGFFSSSNPILPKDMLQIRHYCQGTGSVKLTLDNRYYEYYWNNGEQGPEINSGSGTYQVAVRDAIGNIYRSNQVNINDVYVRTLPVVSAPDGLVGCEGKTVRLVTPESKFNVLWSTGDIGTTLTVSRAGSYSAQYRSDQNCYSNSSQSYNISFKAPPAKPELAFLNGGGYKCDGETVTVAVTNVQGADIQWNTGATTSQITLKDNAYPYVTATLYSLPNCPSPVSNQLGYHLYDKPGIPTISYNGPFYLQAESDDADAGFDWTVEGTRIEGVTQSLLHIEQTGNYKVTGVHTYTTPVGGTLACASAPSKEFAVAENNNLVGFSIYPNPVSTGVIRVTSDGERENVNLTIIDQLGREVYQTRFDKISYPHTLDLTSRNFQGKYFVQLKYEAHSKTFPIVFVK
ncbi:sialate O-acetylesterase [Leadbetterella sp. DM7]|uniref:sialate O-acetylesterase n=1 Tax=Leadbetterella sp. DM7 TaxID=3235085 RepID=UPI00349EE480